MGVSGEAVRSRRGELSLQLDSYELLAPSERPLPDKHHGLADVETRYRQRYLDLLVNPEVRAEFELRARAITALRASSTVPASSRSRRRRCSRSTAGQRAAVHDAPQRARS